MKQLLAGPGLSRAKRGRRKNHDDKWVALHWAFMRKQGVEPHSCLTAMPTSSSGLSLRARHSVGVWRVLSKRAGCPLQVVNVSQSIHRCGGIRSKAGGVMMCITPGGQYWVEEEGRCLSSIEKMIMMGLPVDRMDLGGLGSQEIHSLAGNAMAVKAATCSNTLLPDETVFIFLQAPTVI